MNPKQKAVNVIRGMMSELETDVSRRNRVINDRYNTIYQGGIMSGLKISSGHDVTTYNYLGRVVDIHAAKLFGRMPNIVTKFNTEDIDIYEIGQTDPKQAGIDKEQAKLRNMRKATDNKIRNTLIRAIVADNDIEQLLDRAAHIGSWSGISVIKGWKDDDAKTYKFSLIEQPQNFMRYWANSNFRESDADFFAYQISENSARRIYGSKLGQDEVFSTSSASAWWRAEDAMDLIKDTIKKVWVIDATGYFPGITTDKKGNIVECEPGKETKVNLLIVGDIVVQVVDKDVPTYWVVNNEELAGQPWGLSDVSDELISINRTMIETMSDWRTASWKVTFPKLKFMGYDDMDMPAIDDRTAYGIAVGEGQDIAPLHMENTLQEFPRLMQELWNSFTKLSKVSRVMLDDPSINASSNQALMTSMGGLIDVTEGKQKRWTPVLQSMFETALKECTGFDKTYEEAVNQQDFIMDVKWASAFRREDASYWQMLTNLWNAGVLSVESFLEAMSFDSEDEIARMREDMEDPLRASMVGHALSQMAGHALNKSLGIPPQGYLNTKVQLRGDLSPSEVGNLGATYGLNQGPYGDTIGPQGYEGTIANDQITNTGMLNGNPADGGAGVYKTASDTQPNPTLTPDQNTGQISSMPGSGAPAVSAAGATAQINQRAGK